MGGGDPYPWHPKSLSVQYLYRKAKRSLISERRSGYSCKPIGYASCVRKVPSESRLWHGFGGNQRFDGSESRKLWEGQTRGKGRKTREKRNAKVGLKPASGVLRENSVFGLPAILRGACRPRAISTGRQRLQHSAPPALHGPLACKITAATSFSSPSQVERRSTHHLRQGRGALACAPHGVWQL